MPRLLKKENVIFSVFYIMFFLLVVFLTSHQLSGVKYPSDIIMHLEILDAYFSGKTYIPHPLWHICVHYMSYITLNAKFAASLVTGVYVLFWIYVVHSILEYLLVDKRWSAYSVYGILVLVLMIGPAYLPFFNEHIYLGTGSPNVWHNVTLITVKPFALMTVFFTVLSFRENNIKYYVISIISLGISMFAKPSFAIVFIPALVVYFYVKKDYSKEKTLYVFSLILIFLLISIFQYLNTYGGNNTKIVVDFLGVWSLYTSNVFVSILLALLFPLVYFAFERERVKKDDWLLISWFMIVFSIILFACFAEEGVRYSHGNFSWSYLISLSILYLFSIANYLKFMHKIDKYKKIVLNFLLIYQLYVGAFYMYHILTGESYA